MKAKHSAVADRLAAEIARRLSADQRDALAYIATNAQASLRGFSKVTFYALERRGLIEHTSTGWRLTPAGEAVRAVR